MPRTQVLRRERTELGELVQQAEALRADNAALHRRSLHLPALQEENERLKVSGARCARARAQPRAAGAALCHRACTCATVDRVSHSRARAPCACHLLPQAVAASIDRLLQENAALQADSDAAHELAENAKRLREAASRLPALEREARDAERAARDADAARARAEQAAADAERLRAEAAALAPAAEEAAEARARVAALRAEGERLPALREELRRAEEEAEEARRAEDELQRKVRRALMRV